MSQKFKYYVTTFLLAGLVTFITFFDYITFFEKIFGLDKLNYQYSINYSIYSRKMTPIRVAFSALFFLSCFAIIKKSLKAYVDKDKNEIPKFIPISILTLTIIFLVYILFGGIISTATVM